MYKKRKRKEESQKKRIEAKYRRTLDDTGVASKLAEADMNVQIERQLKMGVPFVSLFNK